MQRTSLGRQRPATLEVAGGRSFQAICRCSSGLCQLTWPNKAQFIHINSLLVLLIHRRPQRKFVRGLQWRLQCQAVQNLQRRLKRPVRHMPHFQHPLMVLLRRLRCKPVRHMPRFQHLLMVVPLRLQRQWRQALKRHREHLYFAHIAAPAGFKNIDFVFSAGHLAARRSEIANSDYA
mmetsp:Transcript_97086/g.192388  ORF Transcript_97086/g.192388 Transcript_97086/m.192388 type:complete len:177 (+) Transcript_97086:51-581(+)